VCRLSGVVCFDDLRASSDVSIIMPNHERVPKVATCLAVLCAMLVWPMTHRYLFCPRLTASCSRLRCRLL
jgi:hypothetical protein